jgi:hypothetical protein
MTRDEKIKKRQERAFKRKGKRIAKDRGYLNTSALHDRGHSLSWGRRRQKGTVYSCEMGYSDCEARGWCNGDC